MSFLRYIHKALTMFMLLVLVTGWFVMPLGSWVPKLAGCEHVVRVGLDHGDLHLTVLHADGSVDHRDHGPECPGHHVPEGTQDHSAHGVHMPRLEREIITPLQIPQPVIRISPLQFEPGNDFSVDLADVDDAVATDAYRPPTELQKTTVLLI